jgi:hypothetical protein
MLNLASLIRTLDWSLQRQTLIFQYSGPNGNLTRQRINETLHTHYAQVCE